MRLHFALLGEPKITCDDAPLTGFISAKAQALLFYLAATGRVHSRDTLATLFWAEMPEAAAKKNLTKALSNLRKLIGNFIDADNQSAGLNLALTPWIDLPLFEEAVDRAETAALPALRQTLMLYAGELLQGFHVKDAPVFEEWLWGERERLQQLAVRGLSLFANRLAAAKDDDQAIDVLTRLLSIDPLHEPTHLQMMLCLARSGQRSAALAHYESCCRLLDEELGVEPGAELTACYERIKSVGKPPPHNLPSTAGFIGREIELAEITALLTDPECRLLTIVGPGGIGKSRLALQAAAAYTASDSPHTLTGTFADGVYFIPLAAHNLMDSVLATIADTLGFTFQGGDPPRRQLINYLRNKQVLLVLDNYEQLLPSQEHGFRLSEAAHTDAPAHGAIAFVNALLDTAPGVRLLITSRIRLAIQKEHVLHLSGMEVPMKAAQFIIEQNLKAGNERRGGIPLEAALEYSSVQLFVQCAHRLRPDFMLTTQNVDHVLNICEQVQGMPLGILLAAAWITVLTPAEIATELSSNLDLLETQEHDVPSRQRSVRAAFDYTWNMLSPREQELYKKLSAFRAPFSRQAAQQVAGASLRELITMVDKSLLSPAQNSRFGMHELLRQFGEEKLRETPELARSVREQHSSYYAHIMAQRTEDFKGAQQRQALLETEADGENVRTAWQWSVEQHQVGQLSQSVDGLCQFYLWRGRFREAEALMRSALSTLGITITATIDPQPLLLQIKLLIWQGIFARILGRREAAEQSLKVTLQLLIHESLHDHDTQSLQAFALLHLGETMREVDRTAARQYYEQSLALYRASDYPWGVANTLDALGWLIQHWGSYDEARQIYQESLTIRQTLDDRRGVANALRAVGGVALYQGDLVQAEKLIRDSIAMMSPKGDRIGLATCLGKLGETLINGGRFQEAEVPLNEAKAIYEGLGMADSKAFIEAILGLALLHQGDYAEAQQRTTSVLDYFQSVGSRRGSAYARLILGWIFLAQNAVTKAYEHLEESRTIYVELSQRDELGQTHALLALVAHLRHNPEGAEHHLQQAQQIAESIQAFMPHLLALAVTTRIQRTQNETPTVWLHNQIAHHPIVVASCWFGQLLSTGD